MLIVPTSQCKICFNEKGDSNQIVQIHILILRVNFVKVPPSASGSLVVVSTFFIESLGPLTV